MNELTQKISQLIFDFRLRKNIGINNSIDRFDALIKYIAQILNINDLLNIVIKQKTLNLKRSVDALSGYAAEMFCASIIKHTLNWIMHFNKFGSSSDRSKTDYSFSRIINSKLEYGDAKGSILYKNCAICANHPYFHCPNDHWFFLVFRDESSIYMVNGKSIYDKILCSHSPKIDKNTNERYFVIKPDDIANLTIHADYEKIPICGKYKTFGDFFNAEFTGNELQKFDDDEQIIEYVNKVIAHKCDNAILNDIPN